MRPLELVEQLVMILIVIAWMLWVVGFVQVPWYRDVLYYATPPPLIVILVLRLLRYRQAVREAESVAEQRGRMGGPFPMP
jgi:cytochrome c oxidase subunit IV